MASVSLRDDDGADRDEAEEGAGGESSLEEEREAEAVVVAEDMRLTPGKGCITDSVSSSSSDEPLLPAPLPLERFPVVVVRCVKVLGTARPA